MPGSKTTAAESLLKLAKLPVARVNAQREEFPELWHQVRLKQIELQNLPLAEHKKALIALHKEKATPVKPTQQTKAQLPTA